MDRTTKTLIHYEWKSFIRNRFQLLMLAAAFAFGIYAIYYGQSEINMQRQTIEAVTALEKKEFFEYKTSFQEELSTLEAEQTHDIASRPAYAWFRHGYHAILPPHDYASLAIGQRDLFRYYYRLTGMSLHYQLFENELANPVNLMTGNFDLSFILIYLFPLLIIAFCYSLFSAERENGTLALLQIQSVTIRKIILVRLAFYFTVVTGLALLISSIGLLTSGNPLAEQNRLPAVAWITGVLAYCIFWFALMFLIVSFRKNSSFNAIVAAGCWLVFLIVVPALLNVLVTTKFPLSSTTLAGLMRRTSLENENDEEEAREVIMEFLEHKPKLAGSDSLLNNDLLSKAYAAFTSLKDLNSKEEVDSYTAQVIRRNEWSSRFYWLSPAVNMQNLHAQMVKTDLRTFLRFHEALANFHGDITDFYFSRLFWNKPILREDYSHLPVFEMPEAQDRWGAIWTAIGKIMLMAVFVYLTGYIKMK
ncbi:DUF3526 domain-containing protein [Fulvivirgaceae bacterium BMA12]|uniref:DUF3526 domain-containing protein n=1 Tax=Agaribacillus aureus TaxID=3051825 RepID=A0ABT8L0Q5_9BACT|nr:DUF3526 domain-containing protein [Fulvivirgaceae bacterium BMA12]